MFEFCKPIASNFVETLSTIWLRKLRRVSELRRYITYSNRKDSVTTIREYETNEHDEHN